MSHPFAAAPMTERERLAEIKGRRAERYDADQTTLRGWADIDWLVDQAELAFELGDLLPKRQLEIDRLRGLLKRLEWAGRDGLWPSCPACSGHQRDGHVGIGPERAPCWLADELAPERVGE